MNYSPKVINKRNKVKRMSYSQYIEGYKEWKKSKAEASDEIDKDNSDTEAELNRLLRE